MRRLATLFPSEFLEFCEERSLTSLNELSGRDLNRYRAWRREDDISTITLRSNMATLRVFLLVLGILSGGAYVFWKRE